MAGEAIRIEGLRKDFGANPVVRGIDLSVHAGERIAILGSSGSGKSTLLRCLNFIETPTAGRIWFDGKLIGDEKRRKRDGGMRHSEQNSAS